MNTQPFFSVIIPTFNRAPLLKIAVDSVLNQTFSSFELIIIDDGSCDNTKDFISSCKDERIIYKNQTNSGVAHARNRGLERSKGDFIAFLDSDDRWLDTKLEKTCEYIKRFPLISIFHTEEIWYQGGKFLAHREKHKKPSGFVYENALPLCCISISTAVIKKDVFSDVGTFDESLEACEDYDFWLRATARYEVKLIPEELTIKDGGRPDQLSSSVWGLDRFRIKALDKMLLSGSLEESDRAATLKEFEKKCAIFAIGCEKRGKLEEVEYYKALAEKHRR